MIVNLHGGIGYKKIWTRVGMSASNNDVRENADGGESSSGNSRSSSTSDGWMRKAVAVGFVLLLYAMIVQFFLYRCDVFQNTDHDKARQTEDPDGEVEEKFPQQKFRVLRV